MNFSRFIIPVLLSFSLGFTAGSLLDFRSFIGANEDFNISYAENECSHAYKFISSSSSYIIIITEEVVKRTDPETGKPIVVECEPLTNFSHIDQSIRNGDRIEFNHDGVEYVYLIEDGIIEEI